MWLNFLPMVDSLPCWVCASTLLLVLQRAEALRSEPPCEAVVEAEAADAASHGRAGALAPPVPGELSPLGILTDFVPSVDELESSSMAAAAARAPLLERVSSVLPEVLWPIANLVQYATSDKARFTPTSSPAHPFAMPWSCPSTVPRCIAAHAMPIHHTSTSFSPAPLASWLAGGHPRAPPPRDPSRPLR